MNDLDLTSIFWSLLKDEGNATAPNVISPPNLTVDSSISLNHSNVKILEEEVGLFTSQYKEFTSQNK